MNRQIHEIKFEPLNDAYMAACGTDDRPDELRMGERAYAEMVKWVETYCVKEVWPYVSEFRQYKFNGVHVIEDRELPASAIRFIHSRGDAALNVSLELL